MRGKVFKTPKEHKPKGKKGEGHGGKRRGEKNRALTGCWSVIVFLSERLFLSPHPSVTPHACAQIKYLFTEEAKRQPQGKSVIQALEMTLLSKKARENQSWGVCGWRWGKRRSGAVTRYLRLVGDSFGQGAWRAGLGKSPRSRLDQERAALGQNAREPGRPIFRPLPQGKLWDKAARPSASP